MAKGTPIQQYCFAGENDFLTVAEYSKAAKKLELRGQNPDWFENDLRPFIEQYVRLAE